MNSRAINIRAMNDQAPDDVRVIVIRAFDAPARTIFDAWLTPDMLARWMFGPGVRDERIVHLRLDAREGGAFSFRVERGGTHIEHVGTYRLIDSPSRLTFTWGAWAVGEAQDASSLVDIAIEPRGSGCELTLTHAMSAEWAEYAARTEQGWRHMLDMLASALSAGTYGVLVADDVICFERLLPGTAERLWSYLIDSEKRARWLAAGPIDPRIGAAIELRFRNAELARDDECAPDKHRACENSGTIFGHVTECEPPHLLAFTWNDSENGHDASEVRFEIEPREDGVQLTLTHRRLRRGEMTSVAGGWHTHLGILEDLLCAREPRPFWRTHTALEEEYVRRMGCMDAGPDLSGSTDAPTKLAFSISIRAPKRRVWETMIDDAAYRIWTSAFCAGSYFDGSWNEGAKIRFLTPDGRGMVAIIAENRPCERISIRHIGDIHNGIEDTESAQVKRWAPAYENYEFRETNATTELRIEVDTMPDFEQFMREAWPKALAVLKTLCERGDTAS